VPLAWVPGDTRKRCRGTGRTYVRGTLVPFVAHLLFYFTGLAGLERGDLT